MAAGEAPVPVGEWFQDQTVGSGGFGTVSLWKNNVTNEAVVLKTCKFGGSMSDVNKKRWHKEIEIMLKLSHPNIVRSLEVPASIDISKESLPPLAMEFCERGDLRKLLRRPENCCGLSEAVVRTIMKHVGAAIEYLHGKRIIHRDLKPENVLVKQENKELVYKLTDLGYAKDLDHESIANSFVGTLQYLAPELFEQNAYSCTVDYWSFGTLVFECITGIRPFHVTQQGMHWVKLVMSKNNDEICIDQYRRSPGFQFLTNIPQPNQLLPTSRMFLEKWLRLMLIRDPRQRGGGIQAETQRPTCFISMDNILNMKLITVYCLSRNQLLTHGQNNWQCLPDVISQETGIPAGEQAYLREDGEVASLSRLEDFLQTDSPVVLLEKTQDNKNTSDHWNSTNIPQLVRYLMEKPETKTDTITQKRTWAHSLFYCQQVLQDFRLLVKATRACLKRLVRTKKDYNDTWQRVWATIIQVKSEALFLHGSIGQDMEHRKSFPAMTGVDEYTSGATTLSKGVEDILAKVKTVEESMPNRTLKVESKVEDYQHFMSCKVSRMEQDFSHLVSQATVNFDRLRAALKENRELSNEKMFQCVMSCHAEEKKLTRVVREAASNIYSFVPEFVNQVQSLHSKLKELSDLQTHTKELQTEYQRKLWHFINSQASSRPAETMDTVTPDLVSVLDTMQPIMNGESPEEFEELQTLISNVDVHEIDNLLSDNQSLLQQMDALLTPRKPKQAVTEDNPT